VLHLLLFTIEASVWVAFTIAGGSVAVAYGPAIIDELVNSVFRW
jgi:hypothetical protein